MTPREQIEAALEYFKDGQIETETIRRCLEFTLRAMGDVSDGMYEEVSDDIWDKGFASETFKAMTAKLWQEVCDG